MLRTGDLYNITKKKSTKDQSGFLRMSSSVYQNLPLAEHMAFPFKQSYIEKSLKPNDIRAMTTDDDCEIMYHECSVCSLSSLNKLYGTKGQNSYHVGGVRSL